MVWIDWVVLFIFIIGYWENNLWDNFSLCFFINPFLTQKIISILYFFLSKSIFFINLYIFFTIKIYRKANSDNLDIICVLGFCQFWKFKLQWTWTYAYAILTFIEQEVEMEMTLLVLVASRSSVCSVTFLISCW